MPNPTSLEKILAYYNIKPFMKDDDWVELGRKIKINQTDLRRIGGKTLEDYFFVMVQCYDNVEGTIVFNEALSKLTDTPSPDGLILFKNGNSFLIEVKSTTEPTWSYSKNRLQKQKEFANKIGLDLFFAIFLNGYWGVYDYDFIESKKFKIEHPQDIRSSLFDSLFDPQLVKIPKGLKIIKHYSTNANAVSPTGTYDPGYGHQTKFAISYGNLYREFLRPEPALAFAAVDASIYNFTVNRINDEVQEVIQECLTDICIYDYRFVLEPIQMSMNEVNKKNFNVSSFIAYSLSIGKVYFIQAKENGISFIEYLKQIGFPFEIAKASESDYFF